MPAGARRSSASPEDLWRQALQTGDHGRPATAVRLCLRALDRLGPHGQNGIRAQILITLACYRSELGDAETALTLLEQARSLDNDHVPAVLTARGMVLLRSGHPSAFGALNEAIDALTGVTKATAKPGAGPSDLASALLNRGVMHMMRGDLHAASVDTEAAERAAWDAERPGVVLMARHNLGYFTFLRGDLPGALQAMSEAAAVDPDATHGVEALDRAKVMLAAGLLAEAAEFTDDALKYFRANRAMPDLAEAFLVRAEIDLLTRDGRGARTLSRRASRIYVHRGNVPATLTARLLELRA